MQRRKFIQQSTLAASAILIQSKSWATPPAFPDVRIVAADRKFTSKAIEKAIQTVQKKIGNKEIAWLFGNCFPNTLDTTVEFETLNGKPDTYVITGDIDAMWLRDSTAQVWPYLAFCKEDKALQTLIAGVINRQTKCILLDPYANAFYKDLKKVSEWKTDITKMQPGIHERKWEVDSLCYAIRLAHGYWKTTGDTSPFDKDWQQAMQLVIKTFAEQQRFEGKGPYTFQRPTHWATDGVPLSGYGYPVKPNGLICSIFRPSDDATIFPYLIPSNYMAVTALEQMAEIWTQGLKFTEAPEGLATMLAQINLALQKTGNITHLKYGKMMAFEVNGYGSYILMDDSNVPSLLSMPYLGCMPVNNPVYQNTRRYILSTENPFFFKGKAAEGIGGPHAGMDMIWPMAITMRGLTSTDDAEISACIKSLQSTHAGTGFMHESFHKDDPTKFTRKWFAWANTLFGEFIWKTFLEKPQLLK